MSARSDGLLQRLVAASARPRIHVSRALWPGEEVVLDKVMLVGDKGNTTGAAHVHGCPRATHGPLHFPDTFPNS